MVCPKKTSKRERFFHARPGISLVACIILIVVLTVSVLAILTTLEWGVRHYAFSREDMEKRMLYFNWSQTFESVYPGLFSDYESAFGETAAILGGHWNSNDKTVVLKGLNIRVRDASSADGVLFLSLETAYQKISGRHVLQFTERFNTFSNETVSDDAIS